MLLEVGFNGGASSGDLRRGRGEAGGGEVYEGEIMEEKAHFFLDHKHSPHVHMVRCVAWVSPSGAEWYS